MKLVSLILLVVGIVHLIPVKGISGADTISELYGVTIANNDLELVLVKSNRTHFLEIFRGSLATHLHSLYATARGCNTSCRQQHQPSFLPVSVGQP